MRHTITSMFRNVLGVRFVISERKQIGAAQGSPSSMITLDANALRQVCGGGGGQDLPKGGW